MNRRGSRQSSPYRRESGVLSPRSWSWGEELVISAQRLNTPPTHERGSVVPARINRLVGRRPPFQPNVTGDLVNVNPLFCPCQLARVIARNRHRTPRSEVPPHVPCVPTVASILRVSVGKENVESGERSVPYAIAGRQNFHALASR